MLNDNFYRGSGITLAIRRLLETEAFQSIEVFLAGAETLRGEKSSQEDIGFVEQGHYRYVALMDTSPALAPALWKFALWLRRMRFDVVHAHHRRLAVLANLVTPISGVPVLFTGHLTFPDAAWFREVAPRRMTGVSPTVVAYLKRCTRAKSVALVYNAVPFPAAGLKPAAARGRRAVAMGRLDPVKGFGTLIKAYAKLRDRGVDGTVDIYGEGSMRAELERQIVQCGLDQRVFLRGFDANAVERLRDYAFHLLTSEREGFPNAVVEAAAAGIPTLLTDVDGSRDALPPQLALPNGLSFGDANALTEALARWYEEPLLVDEDGQRFRSFLEVRCSPNVVGDAYRQQYEAMRGH